MKDTIIIDNEEYIKKSLVQNKSGQVDGLEYVIVRTYTAGVFAGYLKDRDGKEGTLLKARRLWAWYGAASLSQLAQSGTSQPEKCKFPEPVDSILLTEIIEVLKVTDNAKKIIDSVPIWKA